MDVFINMKEDMKKQTEHNSWNHIDNKKEIVYTIKNERDSDDIWLPWKLYEVGAFIRGHNYG